MDDERAAHNASDVLLRLCANTDPQRVCPPEPWRRQKSIFTKGPADVLDHAPSKIASGSKLGMDATKRLPGKGFKCPWPPLIKMDESVKAKVERPLGGAA